MKRPFLSDLWRERSISNPPINMTLAQTHGIQGNYFLTHNEGDCHLTVFFFRLSNNKGGKYCFKLFYFHSYLKEFFFQHFF